MGRGFVGFIGCLFSAPGQASGPEPAPKKYWLRERYCDPHQLTPVCLLTGEGGDCVAGSPRSTAGTSHGPLLVRMGHVPSLSRGASSLQSGCPLSYSLRSLRALNDSDGDGDKIQPPARCWALAADSSPPTWTRGPPLPTPSLHLRARGWRNSAR